MRHPSVAPMPWLSDHELILKQVARPLPRSAPPPRRTLEPHPLLLSVRRQFSSRMPCLNVVGGGDRSSHTEIAVLPALSSQQSVGTHSIQYPVMIDQVLFSRMMWDGIQEDLEHPKLPLEPPHPLQQHLEQRLVMGASTLGVAQRLLLADLGGLLRPPLVQLLARPLPLVQCLPRRSVQPRRLLMEQPRHLALEQHLRLLLGQHLCLPLGQPPRPLELHQCPHSVRPSACRRSEHSQARHLAAQALVQVRHHCMYRG